MPSEDGLFEKRKRKGTVKRKKERERNTKMNSGSEDENPRRKREHTKDVEMPTIIVSETPEEIERETIGMDSARLVMYACRVLGEPNEQLVIKCLVELGQESLLRTLKQTVRIESLGGMMAKGDEHTSRRKTPGGVFFHLVRESCDKQTRRRIFFIQLTASQQRRLARVQQEAEKTNPRDRSLSPPHRKKTT